MSAPVRDAPSFWSDPDVVSAYRNARRSDGPHRTIEQPVILGYIGNVCGREVLDLGCGDGSLGRWALDRGAKRYVGVDVSPIMIEEAKHALAGRDAALHCANLETWLAGGTGLFDIVVSRLALHFVRDTSRVFEIVRHHLRPGGRFVFSVEHPIYACTYEGTRDENDVARRWQVANYFREIARTDHWLGVSVVKYHRTLETWFRTIRVHGFALERFSEGVPARENFTGDDTYEARLDVPICAMFLCVREA